MSSKVRVRILDMSYDKEHNLFKLSLRDLDKHKHTDIAIKGTDWGITPDVSDEIIGQFCKDMIGKEKIIHIEVDNSSLRDGKKDKQGITLQEEINRVNENLEKYPIDEVMNVLHKEEKKDES